MRVCERCGSEIRRRRFCSRKCARGIFETRAERFWRRVCRIGPVQPHCHELGPCWPWTGPARHARGYGAYSEGRGVILSAHRVAWELTRGAIPPGRMVLHSCDNPPCCNPAHLFLGTQADNVRDMTAKCRQARGATHGTRTKPGTLPRGEDHHQARTTVDVVLALRARALTERQSDLAIEFALSESIVSRIVLRRTWKHVA